MVRGQKNRGQIALRIAALATTAWCVLCFGGQAAEVTIPDANLEAAIRVALNQPGGPIEDTGLASITSLNASGLSINNLSGLEFCTSLVSLNLSSNQITDVFPLRGLLNLSTLNLNNNSICSVSYLLENPGFGAGDILQLETNPLSLFTCTQIVPAFQDRGATVSIIGACDTALPPCPVFISIPDVDLDNAIRANLGITGGNLSDLDMAQLSDLDASNKSVANLTRLEYAVNMTQLNLFRNQVSDLAPLAGLTNLTNLNLFSNQISDITPLSRLVNLEDLSLGANNITDISALTNLVEIRNLDLFDNDISDISPIQDMSAIEVLNLASNQVADLSVLNDKTDLLTLSLANNVITDIGPLAGAVSLDDLDLFNNEISDLTALGSMFTLRTLNLGSNAVADLSEFENIDAIEDLDLSNNYITDLSPIANYSDLTSLDVRANLLRDISPLGNTSSIDTLDISDNQIRNLGPLVSLNNLRELRAQNNAIFDVSPLGNLSQVDVILLDNNQICTFAPLSANPSLSGDTDVVTVAGNPLSSFACSLDAGSLAGRSVQVDTGTACDLGGGPPCTGAAIYVSPGGVGFGAPDNPFGNIQDALDAASELVGQGFSVTVFLAPGDYGEVLEIPDGVRVIGSGAGVTRILPTAALLGDDDDDDAVVVRGGDDAGIEDLSIVLPSGAPSATVIEIDGVDFEVLRVEVDGASANESTGVRVKGEDSSASQVRDSTLHDLETAIEIDDSGADFGFNEIRNISGAAAVRITGDNSPRLGDLLDLRRSGSNIFRGIDGRFIQTDSPLELRALANYWDNRSSISAIRSGILGQVNVALPLFTTDSKGILAGSLFATVIDDDTEEPIVNAEVSLVPMAGNLPKSSTPGVYVAGILPAGRYTVRAQEAGYEDEVQLIDVFAGVNQVTLRMGSEGGGSAFIHSGDANVNARIELTELLRMIQLYNSPLGFSCGGGEDGYQLGAGGGIGCAPHAADYEGVNPNWRISLSELLRVVQIYNVGAYFPCGNASEDGFCPGGK